jgi:hypothetical protein
MLTIEIVLAMIAAMAIITAAGFVFVLKSKRGPTDYRALFVMGIISFVAGLLMDNYALMLLSIIISMISVSNKDKWEKNKTNWKKVSKEEKRASAIIFALILVVIIIGVVAYYLI